MVIVTIPSVKKGIQFKVFCTREEARKIRRLMRVKRKLSREDLEKIVSPNLIYEEYDHPHQYYRMRYDFCPICDEETLKEAIE